MLVYCQLCFCRPVCTFFGEWMRYKASTIVIHITILIFNTIPCSLGYYSNVIRVGVIRAKILAFSSKVIINLPSIWVNQIHGIPSTVSIGRDRRILVGHRVDAEPHRHLLVIHISGTKVTESCFFISLFPGGNVGINRIDFARFGGAGVCADGGQLDSVFILVFLHRDGCR